MKGSVQIGFEINREILYVLNLDCGSSTNIYTSGLIVGDYYATFNIRSNNSYRSGSLCEGFHIRKKFWHELIASNSKFET